MVSVRGRALRSRMLSAVLLLAGALAGDPASASDHKQVLVLYAGRRDAQLSIVGETELRRMLSSDFDNQLDYYSEFVDRSIDGGAYQAQFGDFLRVKYRGTRFDLVIALQEGAIDFITHNRDVIGTAPVVFLSNSVLESIPPNATGIVHLRDFTGTLTLIRQLQPDVRQIVVVGGAAAIDREFDEVVRRQFESARAPFTFTYMSGLTDDSMRERLSRLPAHSAVYYTVVNQDADGRRVHPLEYLERVAAVANVPTYSWVDSALDRGIVGGSVYSQKDVIQHVGQLALRVLSGERADRIPVSSLTANRDQVDWRQLRRWRISDARVPAGTLVSFREPTVWDTYKLYIVGAVGLVVVQSSLIGGLLLHRRRRRRAEEELLGSQRELRKSFDRNRTLGARLLVAQDTERSRIARELHDDICQRMLVLTIELESLGRANSNSVVTAREAVTVAQDISRSLHELSHRLHPTRLGLVGLVGAIEHLVSELSRGGVPIVFTHDRVPAAVAPDVMLCLFRVAQEGLHNAVKYSRARQVSVHLLGGQETLTLTMTDDGVGFDVEGAWTRGLGLLSMAERLETLRGSLDIWSRPGQGTRITAVLSLDGAERAGWPREPPAVATI